MLEEQFFATQSASSKVKATIVADYFPQYCRILLKKHQYEIWYLDLFSGPGKYDDGNESTPLLLAEKCAKDPQLRDKVRLLFNDKHFAQQLKENFTEKFPPGTFALEPRFGSETVGESERVLKHLTTPMLGNKNPKPTLLFFDPWGYKGIDSVALGKFLSNWGNELFLFVNTKRINAAIDNNKFDDLMDSLFPTTIHKLRLNKKYKAKVNERLSLIIESLAEEFKNVVKGELYICPFKFQEEDSNSTSHYIVHFTKHSRGYELVKQIYYDYDNIGATLENGVYTFDAKRLGGTDGGLFFGDQNIEILAEQLEKRYRGRTIDARSLFEEHHTSNSWCPSHYAKTLRYMHENGSLTAKFTDNIAHKVSVLINERCILQFKN